MHTIYRGLLLVACLGLTIESQGGGGHSSGGGGGHSSGGGFSGGGGYRGRTRGGGGCSGSCGIILGSIFGGFCGMALLISGIVCFLKHRRARPSRPNAVLFKSEATSSSTSEKYDISIFKSGNWKSHYFQYGKWHGPYRFVLSFDSHSMKITGSGTDNIGKFTIAGTYSIETSRVGLTKTYQAGTGNRSENLGHQVTIQLTWNSNDHQFDGRWYVRTDKYQGDDKFILKFDGEQLFSVNEKV